MWAPGFERVPGPRVAAVIPAAGASVRFQGFPKACLRVGDEAAVRRIVRLCLEAGCSPVIVVVGPHEREIGEAIEGAPVRVVRNPEWSLGRTGSIQVGVREVPEGDDVLLWPVDHPFVEAKSLAALASARERDDLAVWFIPMHLGRGGHPVLLRAPAVRSVGTLRRDEPLRALLPRLGAQVRRVAVSDPGVIENTDTPEEYRRHHAQWRSRWTGG